MPSFVEAFRRSVFKMPLRTPSRLHGTAIVRRPSKLLNLGLVTHIQKEEVDYTKALEQWHQYGDAFRSAGWKVVEIEGASTPDSVFIEDAMVIFGEQGGIVTRPGAEERRPETDDLEIFLDDAGFKDVPIRRVIPPAELDGGDVMKIGRNVFVGRGGRTNEVAIHQLQSLLGDEYNVISVPMNNALHLKSACTALPDGTIIYWPPAFDDRGLGLAAVRAAHTGRMIEALEEPGAHVVNLGPNTVLMSSSAVATPVMLQRDLGLEVVCVPMSEYEKLEGCVTCLSVRIRDGQSELKRGSI